MLILIGCNHRSAPVALRERLAFDDARIPAALRRLLAQGTVAEALVLSTCNRVELLARVTGHPREGAQRLAEFLQAECSLSAEELARHTYRHTGRDAVRHLFEVAAGLDSMILGEPQILGQVKQAYQLARSAGATGQVLERLLQQGLASAKRVRHETGISRSAVSVAFAAVELARRIFGRLDDRRVLLLGAGKMSELVARHLASNGVAEIVVGSRTFDHARTAASRFGGEAVSWEDALGQLERVDIVVSATGAPRPILGRDQVAQALRGRRGRPLFLIDIAVPRDVDPRVNQLDDVYLYDIDGLQGVVDANLEERRAAARRAADLIAIEVEAFDRWLQSLEITPTIVALRERLHELGRRETERFRRRMGPLSPAQEQALDELVRALVQKILHRPIVQLRRAIDRRDVERYVALYEEVFDLRSREPAAPETDAPPGPREAARGPQRLLRGGRDD